MKNKKNMELNQIIKENLLQAKSNKKRQFDESIKNLKKLQNFLNNHILETEEEREVFAMKVFKELLIIESNGDYQKLLTEENTWKGLPTWVWDTIKEKVVRRIVNWVAPSKKHTWAANVVVAGLGDIDINEIPKLGNCDFVTKQIGKAIFEGSIEYVKREKMGISSGISDVIRNSLVETLEQSDFVTKLQRNLGSVLCAPVRQVSNMFTKAGI